VGWKPNPTPLPGTQTVSGGNLARPGRPDLGIEHNDTVLERLDTEHETGELRLLRDRDLAADLRLTTVDQDELAARRAARRARDDEHRAMRRLGYVRPLPAFNNDAPAGASGEGVTPAA
jgi:hypothetical protein